MIIDNVNLAPLLKAFNKLEQFRINIATERDKAGAIQAYEYTFELVWKTTKKLLAVRGLTANSPRETFRLAALEKLIEDPEIWFDFLQRRNLTSHTYEELTANKIIEILPQFSKEVKAILSNIGVNL